MATNGINTIEMGNNVKVLVGTSTNPTDELEHINSVGDITDEATIVDVQVYGEQYLQKLIGSKNAGPIDIIVNFNPDALAAPVQKTMRDAYTNNTPLYFRIQMLNATGDAGDEVTFTGRVGSASISQEFDAVRTQNFNIAIDGAVSTPSAIDFA